MSLTIDEIQSILKNKNKIEDTIISLQEQISAHKKEINLIESHLRKNCKHNWVRDYSNSSDDLKKKYCSICLIR